CFVTLSDGITGDAVLVVFSPRHPLETFDLVVLRATACCVAINAKYATMELDMTLAGMSTAHYGNTDNGNYPSGKHQGQPGTAGALILHLHFAVAAGEVSRLIIGDWANRLDYSVYGDCLASLGPILDGTKKGELGFTLQAAVLIKHVLNGYQLSLRDPPAEGGLHVLLDARELSALMTVVFSTDDAGILSMTDREISTLYDKLWDCGAVTIEPKAETFLQAYGETDIEFLGKFVNQSLLMKLESARASIAPSAASELVQRVVLCYLAALKKYGGVFQQYSVDDKGQTLLAMFGLPPFTHVNNSDRCIKAMRQFNDNLKAEFKEQVDIAISVATGDLLFTTIGTDYRSEAGLLGEVVIIAARLMSTAKASRCLVMDDITYEFVKLSNKTIDLGIVKAKGRATGVHAYGIMLSSEDRLIELTEDTNFGYERERAVIADRLSSWRDSGTRAVLLVEAASGMGKSSLTTFLITLARRTGIATCITQGTEKDQWTPFKGLQRAFAFILEHSIVIKGIMRTSLMHNSSRESFSSLGAMKRRTTATKNDYTIVALHKLVRMAGVEMELAPLFTGVLPGLALTDSDRTRLLDGPARNNLLKSSLVKVITAFVESTAAVFVFDDTQWLDSSTLEVLVQLSRSCPKILTRPLVDSKNKAINCVVDMPDAVHLVLTGFSDADSVQMIVRWEPPLK
ncbi:hypothetical protein HK101_010302, partial [Irineochytrium annulatum]